MKTPLFHNDCIALAPMAGAADSAFRTVAMELGASCCVSEMISSKAVCYGNRNTFGLMRHTEKESPFGIQLFGSETKDFIRASSIVYETFKPDFIDINMGCPAPKIVKSGAGSALMADAETAADIVKAVCDTVPIPVTVKIRSGITEETKNAVSFSQNLEKAGASAIIIHGRTRERMYKPPVDLKIIRETAEALSVPVIGNGDIFSYEDYLRMRETTGCTGVMIGRGALGNPFIFQEIRSKREGLPYTVPTLEQRLAVLRRQARLSVDDKGGYLSFIEIRKHAAWYIKGMRDSSYFRTKAFSISSMSDLDEYISELLCSFNPVTEARPVSGYMPE